MKQNIKKGRYLFYEGEVYDLGGGDDGQAMAKAEEALAAAQEAQTTADGAVTAASTAQTTANAAQTAAGNAQDTADAALAKGLPAGGSSGQVLAKASATDYDAEWVAPPGWDLLWTNASPTSNFAAQTISLNLSNYQFVYVVIKRTADANECFGVVMEKGYTFRVTYSIATSNTINRVYIRFRTYAVSNTGVTCGTGTQLINSDTNNGYCVPLKIWGIKG